MGGSGGGGGISFNDVRENVSCKDLSFRTQLSSPNPDIIGLILEGTELNLVLEKPTGPCNAMFNGKVAGTIIHQELLTLIDCMNKNFKYVAVVRSIAGGNCAITVMAQKRLDFK